MWKDAADHARQGEVKRSHLEKIMAAGVYTNKRPTEAEVMAWMVRHCDGPWRDELAKEQYEDIQRVVERCLQEFREDMTNVSSRSEPLLGSHTANLV